MSLQNYSYFCFDESRQLHRAASFEAASDEDAIALISAKHPDSLCEIWQGNRLVAKLSPESVQAKSAL